MALNPSQRVTYKAEIAHRLEGRSWSEIDLVLEEFGARTTDNWSGSDQAAYVIHMLRDVDDGTLTGMAEHLGIDTGPDTIFDLPAFWADGQLRVFLSHLSQYKEYASDLQADLEDYSISAFVAHEDIEPTKEWQLEIEKALHTCEVLLALLHPGFHDSTWTDQEVGFGLGRGIPVFSIRLGTEPYGLFGRLQAFNGNNKDTRKLAKELFNCFMGHRLLADRMADVIVSGIEASRSYHASIWYSKQLPNLTRWKPDFKERLRGAVENNSQVANGYGVKSRIEEAIERHDPDLFDKDDIPF